MNTIETSIIISVLLIVIFIGLSTIFNEFNNVIIYCNTISTNNPKKSFSGIGNILRITKVVSDTGGEILDEVLQKFKK